MKNVTFREVNGVNFTARSKLACEQALRREKKEGKEKGKFLHQPSRAVSSSVTDRVNDVYIHIRCALID